MTDFRVVIPARYNSSRLPGKVLLEIAGKTMLQRVYESVLTAEPKQIVIATDEKKVADHASQLGAEVCMTSAQHNSGTERIAEVVETMGWADDDIIVNAQADEPLLPNALVSQVASVLAEQPKADMATLSAPLTQVDDIFNPNIVTVVTDKDGFAMYFSRASLPWYRDGFNQAKPTLPTDFIYQRHIGLYAYRAGYIRMYNALSTSPYENLEALEQLRVLWHGGRVYVVEACCKPGLEVNTEEDFQRVIAILNSK